MYDKNLPLIIVNFKTFAETSAEKCFKVASELDRAANDTGLQVAVSVQPFCAAELGVKTDLLVLGQSVDAKGYGSNTGSILPESLKYAGGWGSLVNHSEHRISEVQVEAVVLRMAEVGLKSIVCVESVDEAERYAKFSPDFIAIEPPELIGGDISVSTAQPGLISEAVKVVGDVPLLVGAGVKNAKDLQIALELGAVGVLVASGVCKADSPYEVMLDFAKAVS
jgi:triosephosphate isomerase